MPEQQWKLFLDPHISMMHPRQSKIATDIIFGFSCNFENKTIDVHSRKDYRVREYICLSNDHFLN